MDFIFFDFFVNQLFEWYFFCLIPLKELTKIYFPKKPLPFRATTAKIKKGVEKISISEVRVHDRSLRHVIWRHETGPDVR